MTRIAVLTEDVLPGLAALRALSSYQSQKVITELDRCSGRNNQCVGCRIRVACTRLYDQVIEHHSNLVSQGRARWT